MNKPFHLVLNHVGECFLKPSDQPITLDPAFVTRTNSRGEVTAGNVVLHGGVLMMGGPGPPVWGRFFVG